MRLLTRCDEYESEEDSHSIWKELWFYDWGRKLLHNRLTNSQFVKDYVDDFEKYYETKQDNEDSKSDANVILFLVIVTVIAMTYWVAGQ